MGKGHSEERSTDNGHATRRAGEYRRLDRHAAEATDRVVGIQTKLHRWAAADVSRRFDDLFNLVADPAFMLTAWTRVRGNTGARSAGIDGRAASVIEALPGGITGFLTELREQVRSGASPRFRCGG